MLDHNGKEKDISQEKYQLPKNVNAIAQDTSGYRTYLATNVGLFLIRGNEKPRKLISDYCYTVFVDGTNHIWLSTPKGLFHANAKNIEKGKKEIGRAHV